MMPFYINLLHLLFPKDEKEEKTIRAETGRRAEMIIGKVETADYYGTYRGKRAESARNGTSKEYSGISWTRADDTQTYADVRERMPVMDIFDKMNKSGGRNYDSALPDGRAGQPEKQESETETDIIVKPDGSRVLVVTMNVGGMNTTMTMEISKPTDMQNESRDQENSEGEYDMKSGSLSEGVQNE